MRRYMFLPSFILTAVLFYMPGSGASAGIEGPTAPSLNLEQPIELTRQSILLTEDGVSPSHIRVKREEQVALFVNKTKESLIDVEIDLGSHQVPCQLQNAASTESMVLDSAGILRSSASIRPNQLMSTCFQNSGTYNFTVFGLSSHTNGVNGTIIVE